MKRNLYLVDCFANPFFYSLSSLLKSLTSIFLKLLHFIMLFNKLDRESNQTTVRKLMDKMAKEAFVESQRNKRLGKLVIHSDLTEKKLHEVQKNLILMRSWKFKVPEAHYNPSRIQYTTSYSIKYTRLAVSCSIA
nr:PREDICTED: uncharacterized protein LOC108202793 [Daucus carota subsp. sativus]